MEEQTVESNCNQEQSFDVEAQHIKGVVETILFVNEKPVTLDQLKKVITTVTPQKLKKMIQSLQEEYEVNKKGVTIVEIAGGYQMLTNSCYAEYIRKFYKTKHKEKLSKPALETIAIVAYKQPVTRNDIEIIRGVNSDGVVGHLLNKELVKIVGRKDVPGKPYLYGTTKLFLEYFGLKSLADLPKLEEFPDLLPPEDREDVILDHEQQFAEGSEQTENPSTEPLKQADGEPEQES